MIKLLFRALKKLHIRKQMNKSVNPPIFALPTGTNKIFFGDSIFLRVSANDKNIVPLKEMLSEYPGNSRICVFAHSALAMPHYLMYLLCAKQELDEVHQIIIPINYRAFSLQWELNPDWQYKDALQKMIEISGANGFTMRDIVGDRDYKLADATYFKYGKQTNDFFLKSIAERPSSVGGFIERLRRIFAFNYLFDESVIVNSKRFYAYGAIINEFEHVREKLIFFVPPINYQAIEFLLGEEAIDYLNRNIELVVSYGRKLGVKVYNFSMSADRFCFFSEFEATEHLNERGRKILLSKINEVITNG